MTTFASPIRLTPEEVERASKRDDKIYELIDGELKEKVVGTEALFVASRISERLNAAFYPHYGFSVCEGMVYCFDRPNHGRKPDVVFVQLKRLPERRIPTGDLHIAPDLVVEVISPGNLGTEMFDKLDEYLGAGIPMVWIVNPSNRTIRVYRDDGTTRLFHSADVIENDPLLPGLRLVVNDVMPPA